MDSHASDAGLSGGPHAPRRRDVAAWASWDFGSAAFNAVIVTFVFSVYLTDSVGATITSSVSPVTWLSIALTISSLIIAVTAPVAGARADQSGHPARSVAVFTLFTACGMAAMFMVTPTPTMFVVGLVLMGLCSCAFQFAEVSYFAMLRSLATPATIGRISGLGWAAGYVGGIALLLISFFGFIAGDDPQVRGAFGVPAADGFPVRVVALLSAAWFVVFALPLVVRGLRRNPTCVHRSTANPRVSLRESYRQVWLTMIQLWRTDRRAVRFLLASAVFRDGVASVFAFGAILAVSTYGINEADVLLFGVAANVVAALGAAVAGFFDDRFGPRPVIMVSLAVIAGGLIALFFVDGPAVFWTLGLLVTAFVGPVQSAARSYMARIATPQTQGQMFGLYAMTGRACSFLGPAAFAIAVSISGSDRGGIIGIVVVLIIGSILIRRVR